MHLLVYALLVVFVLMAWVASSTQVRATNTKVSAPYDFVVTPAPSLEHIAAYLVMDEATGAVLLEKDADTKRPTASVIKLIVAAAAYESDLLEATTTIMAADVALPEDFGKLAVGEVYSLRELLFPYLLESSNDAGATIERVWGQALTPRITELLAAAGVTDGVVVADFNGLSPETAATPQALATLLRYITQEVPAVIDISQLRQYVGQKPLVNNNPLVRHEAYRGGKHGYTEAAGRTIAFRDVMSFADGERPLIVVLLGTPDIKAAYTTVTNAVAAQVTRVEQTATSSAILPAS